MRTHTYYLHALTALHVGTGQGVGLVDLPIAREKATQLPMIPGSAMKGVLRAELSPENNENGCDKKLWATLFGPKEINSPSDSFSGSLAVGDAQLLCLPVRSLQSTFAWATCPFILKRYARDTGLNLASLLTLENNALLTEGTTLEVDGQIYLEELNLVVKKHQAVTTIAEKLAQVVFNGDSIWQDLFKQHFVILPDDVFSFLAETATEIRARISIDSERRTVKKGALWTEENLPAESILWGVLGIDRSFSEDKFKYEELYKPLAEVKDLQVGGKATVGRGRVKWILSERKGA